MDERERERIRQRKLRKRRVRRIKKMIRAGIILLMMIIVIVIFMFACSKDDKEEQKQEDQIVEENLEVDEPEVYVEPEIDILMIGDILLHENVQESGLMADGTYNYDHMFENIKSDVQEAEIAIVNQEVILGGKELGLHGYPSFNGAFEVGDALVDAGFNVILHATNHSLDRGKTALLNCLNFWKTTYPNVGVLGIFDSQESYDNDIYVYEQDGVKIAILNYTYGTNGIALPDGMPYAVAMLEEEKVVSDIQKANEIADFVVVCPHWGVEYQHEQNSDQEYWADLFMENGVDLVIGTHAHYIQPVEMLTDEAGNQMLVYWSLGNFINSTSGTGAGTSDRMVGAMAEVTVAKSEEGEIYIKDYGVEPLVTQLLYGPQEITTYKLADYTEELAVNNKVIEKDSAFSLEYCQNLCKEVFGELYE